MVGAWCCGRAGLALIEVKVHGLRRA